MKNALLVYNALAGRFRIIYDINYVISYLEEQDIRVTLWSTLEDGSAITAGEKAARDCYDYLIVMGGDGTLNQVVNGLVKHDFKPCLGLIPYGTTNDFANHFNLLASPQDACKIIVRNNIQYVDIGKVDDKYVLYVIAGGSLSSASFEASSSEKKVLGRLAYFLHGAKSLLSFKPFHLRITTENIVFEDKVSLFIISNTNCIGGFKNLLPNANPSDGLFDVLIVKNVEFAEIIDIFNGILMKGTLNHPKIVAFRAKNFKIESNENIQLSYDGEAGNFLPVNVKVIPQRVKMLVP